MAYQLRISDWSSDVCSSYLSLAQNSRLRRDRLSHPIFLHSARATDDTHLLESRVCGLEHLLDLSIAAGAPPREVERGGAKIVRARLSDHDASRDDQGTQAGNLGERRGRRDRKSTRLNSSH